MVRRLPEVGDATALPNTPTDRGQGIVFTTISKDWLVREAMTEVESACQGWLAGPPQHEVALLSRITERLLRQRRGCDVGLQRRVTVVPEVSVWDRKGPGTSDLSGCDLAVTLNIPAEPFLKTACFQLKRSENGKVRLDLAQVAVAGASLFKHQAFLLAADDQTGECRITPVLTMSAAQETQKTAGWLTLSDWLVQWLDCAIGAALPAEKGGLEKTLRDLFGAQESDALIQQFALPYGVEPLRVWLRVNIQAENDAA
jgi:hypothetical protein